MKTLAIVILLSFPVMLYAQNTPINLLIGTYTNTGKSDGIYVYAFDPVTGQAERRSSVTAKNPSFLAVSADRRFVYAVNENGDGNGAATAYRYEERSGTLTSINTQLTQGDSPCHIVTDSKGRHVIVSNYSGGSISVFPLRKDGGLGPLSQLIRHEGSGPDPDRQKGPHVHSAFFSPDEKRLYVQDLGTDKVNIYDYKPENTENPLEPSVQPSAAGSPGGGPRHLAVSADGRTVYVVQEMAAKVMVYMQQAGELNPIQEIEINQPGFAGKNGAADIKASPDGRFLYASNRGDANTLAIYRINEADGRLTKIGNQSVLGKGPRNFAITPDGRFLLVANQQSDEVVIFKRNPGTGLLNDSGNRIAVGSPVCIVF